MENFTNEQLDQQLGTGSKQFTRFRTITVDNGSDIQGTGATGEFIEKQYDSATQTTAKIPFSDIFQGVILASKAQVADKAKYPTWRTDEFDPSNVSENIAVYPLMAGKFIKNPEGEIQKNFMTYRDLKFAKSTPQPDGTRQSTYNYFIILYVGVNGEVLKLKFKGASRGNFFDFNKAVAQLGAKIYNVNTVFSTYETDGKYAIKFDVEKDDKGVFTQVDASEVRAMRVQVAQSFQAFAGARIGAPEQVRQIDEQKKDDNEEVPFSGII